MSDGLTERPLKVCCTCRHWTYKYKGLCTRLNQGVGKFWICTDWMAAEDHSPVDGQTAAATSPPAT